MSTQENMQLVKRFYEEVHNKGNLNSLDELFDANITIHDPALPNQRGGLRNYKEAQAEYKRAFPDKKVKIEEIIAIDDKVIARWMVSGTHKGNLKDVSATNKNFTITGLSLYLIKNGKIKEIHQHWDRLGLLEQLGEIQPAIALH